MHISKMKQSRCLKVADIDPDVVVTIKDVKLEDIGDDEEKYVLYTDEFPKGLVLNWTNAQLIAKATRDEDTTGWMGHKIVLYHDETVQFRGQVVGGIRVRPVPKAKAKADPDDPIPGWDDAYESA